MRVQSLIVDDFYNNVDEVRAFALNQEFSSKGNYPGPLQEMLPGGEMIQLVLFSTH
jgi:hypothetical protein